MEGAQVALAVFISITFFLILIIGLYLYFSKYVHISWQMLLKKRINYIMTREKNLNIHSIIFTIFRISTYFQHGNTTATLCHAMREAVQMQSHAMCMQAFSNINFWTLSQIRRFGGLWSDWDALKANENIFSWKELVSWILEQCWAKGQSVASNWCRKQTHTSNLYLNWGFVEDNH